MQQDLQTSVLGKHLDMPNVDEFFDNVQEFGRLMMMYNCAIKEVTTKFDVLNDDMSVRFQRNPIETVKSRIKKPRSIVKKLMKNDHPVTL
jgi:putative GTP pyrophosphokinase